LPVFLIFPLFDRLFLKNLWTKHMIRGNVLHGDFPVVDRKSNTDAMIDDNMSEMEISTLERKKFRQLHPDADLEERIYQQELSYSARKAFIENHPEFNPLPRRRKRK